jgi:hypothetical protein
VVVIKLARPIDAPKLVLNLFDPRKWLAAFRRHLAAGSPGSIVASQTPYKNAYRRR